MKWLHAFWAVLPAIATVGCRPPPLSPKLRLGGGRRRPCSACLCRSLLRLGERRLRLQQLKLGRLRLRLRRHDPIIYSHRDRDRHWQRCAQNLHARCRDLDEWPPIDLDSQLHSGLTHDVRHVAALQTKLALEDLHLLGECRRRRADWRHRALSEAFFISRRKETPLEAGDVEFRVYPVALLLVGLP